MPDREMLFREAIGLATAEEMRRDETVFVMGEDVGASGGIFKCCEGLFEEFGGERVIDTPIAEAGYIGLGVGAAMTGMRPLCELMFGDFSLLTMDQLVNQAAKIRYMSGGQCTVPLTVRLTIGAGRSSAAQHSQSLHAIFAHVPGLKVAVPATPRDAKGLLKSAIRDDNPVLFFEDKLMYNDAGPVPEEDDFVIPFGEAEIKRAGDDLTIVATSSMVAVALEAAEQLSAQGLETEVVDPRTLSPSPRRPCSPRCENPAMPSSSARESRALAPPPNWLRSSTPKPSTISTRPCCESAPPTYPFPSVQRSKCRPSPTRSNWSRPYSHSGVDVVASGLPGHRFL